MFLVTPKDSGVTVWRQETVDGDPAGLLELDDVALDDDRVLDGVGGRGAVVEWLATRGTVGLCTLQASVSTESAQMTAAHASRRMQFDRPIATFQAVGQRLANCYIDAEAIRLTLGQAAWRLSENLAAHNEIATAKFWARKAGTA